MTGANMISPHRYSIRVIRAGLSLNGNFYPDQVLQEAVPLFDGTRVFVKSDADHLASRGKDVRNLVGRIVRPRFVAGAVPDQGELQAELELIEPEGEVGRKVAQAWQRGMTDLFGFSIDASGRVTEGRVEGRPVRVAQSLTRVHSVDLIVEPGAGGQVLDLLEAAADNGEDDMRRERIIELIKGKRPKLLEGKDAAKLTDKELEDLLSEAMGDAEDPAPDGTRVAEAVAERSRLLQQVHRSRLPEAAKQRVVDELSREVTLTEAAVSRRIMQEADYISRTGGGWTGNPRDLGVGSAVELRESRDEKIANMLDAFFDPADNSVVSIRECYLEITGDKRFTGLLRNCDRARLREALGSQTLADALGNSISRRMVAEYRQADAYDVWRDMVDIAPVSDFRLQERTRLGGYGDLPKVAEKAPYQPMQSPADEKATYQIEKRGGTEELTLEMITNDDANLVKRIPQKLAMAAKRTLSRFVLSLPKDNPAIYDGKALFHVDHANLGSAALSSAAIGAARLAIKHQKEAGSEEPLSIPAAFLWVPDALEEAAYNLFRRNTNNDADFIQSLQLQVRPVWCWSDPDDWMVTARTRDIPFIELGFLGGNEDPELFVQDDPKGGSMFANDVLTYKIRHIYGGTVVDFRGAYKSVVSSPP